MGRFSIVDATKTPFVGSQDSPERPSRGFDFEYRVHYPGGERALQLFEIRLAPNGTIPSHAHESDEIVYVVEGSLIFGRRECGPGSSVAIEGATLYELTAGPAGCTFLNFRATEDRSYIAKSEYTAWQADRRQTGMAT
jgi:hypothetical protein